MTLINSLGLILLLAAATLGAETNIAVRLPVQPAATNQAPAKASVAPAGKPPEEKTIEKHGAADLSGKEKETLCSLWSQDIRAWRPDQVEQRTVEIGKICAKYRLTRNEVVSLVGNTLVNDESCLAYPYGPSRALVLNFDKKGNLTEVRLAGRSPLWKLSGQPAEEKKAQSQNQPQEKR